MPSITDLTALLGALAALITAIDGIWASRSRTKLQPGPESDAKYSRRRKWTWAIGCLCALAALGFYLVPRAVDDARQTDAAHTNSPAATTSPGSPSPSPVGSTAPSAIAEPSSNPTTFFNPPPHTTKAPPPPPTQASPPCSELIITSPGDYVDFQGESGVPLSGRACGLNGRTGWLFDYDSYDNSYWVVGDGPSGASIVADGPWSYVDSPIGDPGDFRKLYRITLVLATSACSSDLRAALDVHDGEYTNAIPSSCQISDSVDVFITYPE